MTVSPTISISPEKSGQPSSSPVARGLPSGKAAGFAAKKIWIDLDNTPHVPFFKPIIRELERRGYSVVLTARDAFQVCELATQSGLNYTKVGRHHGKNRIFKVLGLVWRSLQLMPFFLREKPVLGLSHGSRAQILLCNILCIPTVMVMDYEFAKTPLLLQPRWEIVPEVLFNEKLQCTARERIRKYPGIKEDVYAPEFKPDPTLVDQLSLNGGKVIVTVRPPANEAHYHNPESDIFFEQFMKRAYETPTVKVVLLPRNKLQENQIRTKWPQWFSGDKALIPSKTVDGLNLLWHSDLVVSGGGTMNREAAALGIPVYSIFRGKIGAVDRDLQKQGRLTLIERVEDVQDKITIQRREKNVNVGSTSSKALQEIVNHVEEIIKADCSR
jgi:predicted glycosyltransferase